jgi:CheY-like chemotaxis protein
MTITPVLDRQGGITEFVAIKQDVTERKMVERMKSEFVSTVSHELRTPLTSIRGSLGLVAGGVAGELPPQVQRLIGIALSNSDRLVRLINDILDIEKIESGRMDFRKQPADLVGIVRQALEANQAFAAQHNVALELLEAPAHAEVLGDSDRLIQVMTNLLSNAAKFSPPGGRVTVRITPDGQSIHVSVADQGPGIPDEFRSRIFRKFAQADSSDTRQKGGTGLGLSIAKAIVEMHGGRIGFETEAGRGTTFWFEIPEHRPQPTGDLAAPRVLICEDHVDTATLLAMVLEQAGFQVMVAHTARKARALLSQHQFDAMTVDVQLPDQDGISLIRELRANPGLRSLPIVVISGESEADRDALAESGTMIVEWIEKPITPERIAEALQSAILLGGGTAEGETKQP